MSPSDVIQILTDQESTSMLHRTIKNRNWLGISSSWRKIEVEKGIPRYSDGNDTKNDSTIINTTNLKSTGKGAKKCRAECLTEEAEASEDEDEDV